MNHRDAANQLPVSRQAPGRAVAGRLITAIVGPVILTALLALSQPALAQSPPSPGPAPARPGSDAALPRVLLVPERETTLVAPMAGTVQQLPGSLGAPVARGAVLARFECSEQRARHGMARAELQAAEEQLKAKERLQGLAAAGDVEVSLARSQVARASAQLQLASAQVAQCTTVAPFAGRLARLHIREFQGVTAGQPMLDLVSGGPLRLRLNVPSRWLGWLKPGSPFTIRIDETGRDYPARVTAINARVDAASQTIELEGRVDGTHPELLAGMSGVAHIVSPAR